MTQQNWNGPQKVYKRGTVDVYFKREVKYMKKVYSDQFKLSVVKDYYSSPLGVRAIALKYNLPSKNYINKWEEYLKKKGLLPPDSTKPNKTMGRTSEAIARCDNRTEREKQYESEIEYLKARIAYYENLEYMQPFVKKTKDQDK